MAVMYGDSEMAKETTEVLPFKFVNAKPISRDSRVDESVLC